MKSQPSTKHTVRSRSARKPARRRDLSAGTVVAIGFDVVETARVQQVLDRHADRFLKRVLTPAERAYVRSKRTPLPHVAGRFAAKEAVLKILGTGWRGPVSWTDVEVLNDAAGRPSVRLSGACARIAARRSIKRILVSISHTRNLATASAIGLSA